MPPGLEPNRKPEPYFTHRGLLSGEKFWSRVKIENSRWTRWIRRYGRRTA